MADMFRAVVCSSTGRPRRWRSSLPLSVAFHGVVLAAAVIVPLAATGALPTPASMLSFSVAAPPPPPEMPADPSPASSIAPAPAPVPIEAPTAIAPEPPPVTSVSAPPMMMTGAMAFGPESGASLLAGGGGKPVFLPAPPPTPIRPGDRVRAPVKIVDVAPVYPPLAVRARVAGVVTIDAVIGVDGRVTEVRVLRSSPLLDDAALDAVRQWRYTPTLLNGVAVPVILPVRVNFALK
jgi:protein TonB